jgi:hypothetical protein
MSGPVTTTSMWFSPGSSPTDEEKTLSWTWACCPSMRTLALAGVTVPRTVIRFERMVLPSTGTLTWTRADFLGSEEPQPSPSTETPSAPAANAPAMTVRPLTRRQMLNTGAEGGQMRSRRAPISEHRNACTSPGEADYGPTPSSRPLVRRRTALRRAVAVFSRSPCPCHSSTASSRPGSPAGIPHMRTTIVLLCCAVALTAAASYALIRSSAPEKQERPCAITESPPCY